MVKVPRIEIAKRSLPRMRGWARKFSSFLRFQQYRPDEVSVSTVIVALDGTGDFDDIQAAIDSLPDTGGRIQLKDGTYTLTSTITINKSNVRIIGSGKSTIIETAADIIMFFANTQTDISISYMLIKGTNNVADVNNAGILFVTCNRMLVENCWIENTGRNGIHATFSCTNTIIRNNRCDNNHDGILLLGGNCIAENNYVTNARSNGFLVQLVAHGSIIKGNKIDSSVGYGIDLNSTGATASDNCCIEGNTITNNGAYGIRINTDSESNVITGNVIKNNAFGTIEDLGNNTQIGHNITD